jgi:hypothetical protein
VRGCRWTGVQQHQPTRQPGGQPHWACQRNHENVLKRQIMKQGECIRAGFTPHGIKGCTQREVGPLVATIGSKTERSGEARAREAAGSGPSIADRPHNRGNNNRRHAARKVGHAGTKLYNNLLGDRSSHQPRDSLAECTICLSKVGFLSKLLDYPCLQSPPRRWRDTEAVFQKAAGVAHVADHPRIRPFAKKWGEIGVS